MGHTMRGVLDTHVVVSALLFRDGPAGRIRKAWQTEGFIPLLSTATVQELIRVLTYPKFKLDANAQQELLSDYLPWSCSVRVTNSASASGLKCRDPFDLPFLHLALAGKAKALVTGDRDLRELAERVPFAILSPTEFLETL